MNYLYLVLIILGLHCVLSRIERLVEEFYNDKLEKLLTCIAGFTLLLKFATKIFIKSLQKDIVFSHLFQIFVDCTVQLTIATFIIPQLICILFALYYKFKLKEEVKNEK